MKCSVCGAAATGNFCQSCGEPLGGRSCSSCGETVPTGTRFCTGCGTRIEGEAGGGVSGGEKKGGSPHPVGREVPSAGNAKLAWSVAGVLMVIVIFALGYPVLSRSSGPTAGMPTSTPAGTGTGTEGSGLVDLTTMPLGEQATTLFNRVMASSSAGDTADVNFFLPKAIIIYEQLNPTDPDGLFHFALLHQVNGDAESALAKAREGLAEIPDYLLLLAAAAEASATLGDEEAAREFYGHFLRVYDVEMELMRPGYEHHQPIFPAYREEAVAFLNRG